jgi:DNA-binding IclR family transcriptional regulator
MTTPTTPAVSERALRLLEIVARAEEPPTLNELTARLDLPKATTHRFATLMERLGFLRRSVDGRRYEVGPRLAELAGDVMRNAAQLAPRRAILSALVRETGETCNITMLDGAELVYLDRVESDWPLQIRLKVGSRVPLHCTASGKLFLAMSQPALRQAFLRPEALPRHTPRTITDPAQLAVELDRIRESRIGTDDEEFIEGMTATAAPVLDSRGRICATVAVHGPTARLPLARALELAPALRRAAEAIAVTFAASAPGAGSRAASA